MKTMPDKEREFDNILNDCLDRMVGGGAVEQCLADYPEAAVELEPLLRMAAATRAAVAVVPRSDFRARARYEFRAALHDELTRSPSSRPAFSPRRGWVTALLVVSILLVSGGGTALAANDSLPDSRLYPVKLASEQVQLALTPSTTSKVQLFNVFAERRVDEIIQMAAKGDSFQVAVTTERLDEELNKLAVFVSDQWGGGMPPVEEATLLTTTAEETAPVPTPNATSVMPVPETNDTPSATTSGEHYNGPPAEEEPRRPETDVDNAPGNGPQAFAVPPSESTDGEVDTNATGTGKGAQDELKVILVNSASQNTDTLRGMLDEVSPALQNALNQAIAVSEEGYRRILQAID